MEDRRRNIREINKDRILKNANIRERKRRLAMRRIRSGILLAVIVLLVLFVLLMTPLFNIRTIGVNGNSIVSISTIDAHVSDLVGKNLIRVSTADVKKRLEPIAYIKDCQISKKLIPATLYIKISENTPAAYLNIDGRILVLDSAMTVIDDSNSISVGSVPQILGINTVKYSLGKTLQIDDPEKENIVSTILATASQTGIINGITKIDAGNTLEITFNYDNRLIASCGTSLELERKVRMFKETVTNASMAEDATGTVDLSEPGKAIYTPDGGVAQTPNTVTEDKTTDKSKE